MTALVKECYILALINEFWGDYFLAWFMCLRTVK